MKSKFKPTFTLVFMLLVSFLLLSSCANQENQSLSPRESSIFSMTDVKNCKVTADKAEVKSGAGDSFQTVETRNQGDVLKVLGQVGNWYVVQLDNNKVGCVDTAKTKPVVREGDSSAPSPAEQTPPTPKAKATLPSGEPLTTQESRMVELVNNERKKNNLPPLKVDPELTSVARIKSQDMIDNNYFSHNSPTYGSPADMLKTFGIDFLYVGENIASNANVERAHEGLMGSAGHRQNILRPEFTHFGIGIKQKGSSYIYTQLFVGRPE